MGISISATGSLGLSSPAAAKQSQTARASGFEAMLTVIQNNASSGSGTSGPAAGSAGSYAGSSNATDPVVQAFMNYMNESTAQKFEDAWLASHGLTEADLKKMTPAERDLILKEMAQDMKRDIEQKTQEKLDKTEALT